MIPLLLQGGRIIDPSQGIDEKSNLLITEGKISWLGKGHIDLPQSDFYVIDCRRLIVCPGFIDLHCHLRQPGFEYKETIATGAKAAAKGGFSTICCMPNTDPPLDNRVTIDYVKGEAEKEGRVRVLPAGCITRNRKGKELAPLRELASAEVVGFSDDGDPVMDTEIMLQAMRESKNTGLPVIDHCEQAEMTRNSVMNSGSVALELGLVGMPSAAEYIMVDRDISLARITGAHLHIAHVSTRESVNIIRRARKQGVRVTAEVTPHHLTLTEEEVRGYNANAKVNPPLRRQYDIRALINGLKDNTIDAIATDHAPHSEAEKNLGFDLAPFGISGFETAFGSLMGLVHNGELSLTALISKLTCEPARIIGNKYGKLGTLAIGAPADITIFDPKKEWVVDTRDFASKGKNTPLEGASLKGKVMATVYSGNLIYKDDSINLEENKESVKSSQQTTK